MGRRDRRAMERRLHSPKAKVGHSGRVTYKIEPPVQPMTLQEAAAKALEAQKVKMYSHDAAIRKASSGSR